MEKCFFGYSEYLSESSFAIIITKLHGIPLTVLDNQTTECQLKIWILRNKKYNLDHMSFALFRLYIYVCILYTHFMYNIHFLYLLEISMKNYIFSETWK